MISHTFIDTEKLRSWHINLLRYTLVACGDKRPKQKTASDFNQLNNTDQQSRTINDALKTAARFNASSVKSTYINHPVLWRHNKIIVHASSSKLGANPAHYASYGLVFASCSGQMPNVIKAKQSVASFKLVKASVIGLQAYIRGRQMDQFHYKWSFLAASASGAANVNSHNNAYGLTNIFVFPELDLLDYYAFEPLSGLDLIFH